MIVYLHKFTLFNRSKVNSETANYLFSQIEHNTLNLGMNLTTKSLQWANAMQYSTPTCIEAATPQPHTRRCRRTVDNN